MSNPESAYLRIERAIYLVGGLGLFLWGFQSVVLSLLSLYDAEVPGPAPGLGSHFWVDLSVGIFVGLVIVFAGFFLLFLAMRTHRMLRSMGIQDAVRP